MRRRKGFKFTSRNFHLQIDLQLGYLFATTEESAGDALVFVTSFIRYKEFRESVLCLRYFLSPSNVLMIRLDQTLSV